MGRPQRVLVPAHPLRPYVRHPGGTAAVVTASGCAGGSSRFYLLAVLESLVAVMHDQRASPLALGCNDVSDTSQSVACAPVPFVAVTAVWTPSSLPPRLSGARCAPLANPPLRAGRHSVTPPVRDRTLTADSLPLVVCDLRGPTGWTFVDGCIEGSATIAALIEHDIAGRSDRFQCFEDAHPTS